jgi:hypothetical protein
MLAQNFKAASDLGISEIEHRALITVLGMLERDEIPFEDKGEWSPMNGEPVAFNMMHVYGDAPCGTVCCLAGWAEYVAQARPFSLFGKRNRHEGLKALLDPYFGRGFRLERIAPAQAAVALRSFLTTGDPDWMSAIGREPVQ